MLTDAKGKGLADLYESKLYADIIFNPLKKYSAQMEHYRKQKKKFEENKKEPKKERPIKPNPWNEIDFPEAKWPNLSKAIKSARLPTDEHTPEDVETVMNTNYNNAGSPSLTTEWNVLTKLLTDFRKRTELLATFKPSFDAHQLIIKYKQDGKPVDEPLTIDISFQVEIDTKKIVDEINKFPTW